MKNDPGYAVERRSCWFLPRTAPILHLTVPFFLAMMAAVPASADVLVLTNGQVWLGQVVSNDRTAGVVLLQGQNRRVLPFDAVAEVIPRDMVHEDLWLIVVLDDHSVVRGRLVDYEPGLGLFMDISYRVLNLPEGRIREVYTQASIEGQPRPTLTVFRLTNGRIILGQPGTKDLFTQTILGISGQEIVNLALIDHVDPGIESLTDTAVEVETRDGTIIRGTIEDYHAVLGLMVKVTFGTLNVPPSQIRSIHTDPRPQASEDGLFAFDGGFMVAFPLVNSPVQWAYGPDLAATIRIPAVPGLTVGETMRYLILETPSYPHMDFSLASISALADWAFGGSPRGSEPVWSPFVTVSAGIGMVNAIDREDNYQQGGVEMTAGLSLGLRYRSWPVVFVRLAGTLDLVFQRSGVFVLAGVKTSAWF